MPAIPVRVEDWMALPVSDADCPSFVESGDHHYSLGVAPLEMSQVAAAA
jgi:hypothetical protein